MSLSELKAKLTQYEKEFDNTKRTVLQLMEESNQSSQNNHIYCYFNYAIDLEHQNKSKRLIFGDFSAVNVSNQDKNAPTILIKITTEHAFNFTGKFETDKKIRPMGFQWERLYVNNLDLKTHFLLKPIHTKQLKPNDMLTFNNFQITIPKDASIIVEGYVYFDGKNDGIASVNTIELGM